MLESVRMKGKFRELGHIGSLEVYKADRLRPLLTLFRWARNHLISCFPTRLVLWADFYAYDPENKAYVPYGVYNRRVRFLDMFNSQQATREHNIKVMPSVGCLE